MKVDDGTQRREATVRRLTGNRINGLAAQGASHSRIAVAQTRLTGALVTVRVGAFVNIGVGTGAGFGAGAGTGFGGSPGGGVGLGVGAFVDVNAGVGLGAGVLSGSRGLGYLRNRLGWSVRLRVRGWDSGR